MLVGSRVIIQPDNFIAVGLIQPAGFLRQLQQLHQVIAITRNGKHIILGAITKIHGGIRTVAEAAYAGSGNSADVGWRRPLGNYPVV
jgi:hypothetical protein